MSVLVAFRTKDESDMKARTTHQDGNLEVMTHFQYMHRAVEVKNPSRRGKGGSHCGVVLRKVTLTEPFLDCTPYKNKDPVLAPYRQNISIQGITVSEASYCPLRGTNTVHFASEAAETERDPSKHLGCHASVSNR